jgi:hypothetical protein
MYNSPYCGALVHKAALEGSQDNGLGAVLGLLGPTLPMTDSETMHHPPAVSGGGCVAAPCC